MQRCGINSKKKTNEYLKKISFFTALVISLIDKEINAQIQAFARDKLTCKK